MHALVHVLMHDERLFPRIHIVFSLTHAHQDAGGD